MKHLILIWVIMFTMVGCEKPTMVDGKPNLEKGKDYIDYGRLSYIMFDAHEYVIWQGHDSNGITHSPKCKCLKRFK